MSVDVVHAVHRLRAAPMQHCTCLTNFPRLHQFNGKGTNEPKRIETVIACGTRHVCVGSLEL